MTPQDMIAAARGLEDQKGDPELRAKSIERLLWALGSDGVAELVRLMIGELGTNDHNSERLDEFFKACTAACGTHSLRQWARAAVPIGYTPFLDEYANSLDEVSDRSALVECPACGATPQSYWGEGTYRNELLGVYSLMGEDEGGDLWDAWTFCDCPACHKIFYYTGDTR